MTPGRILAAQNLARAVRNVEAGWLNACTQWVLSQPHGTLFTFNHVRDAVGDPAYGSRRAIGQIARDLVASGEIEQVGYTMTTSKGTHQQPIRQYRRVNSASGEVRRVRYFETPEGAGG